MFIPSLYQATLGFVSSYSCSKKWRNNFLGWSRRRSKVDEIYRLNSQLSESWNTSTFWTFFWVGPKEMCEIHAKNTARYSYIWWKQSWKIQLDCGVQRGVRRMDWLQFHGAQTPTRFSMDIKNVHTIHGKIVWKKVQNAKLNNKDAAGNESGATVPDLLTVSFCENLLGPKKVMRSNLHPQKTSMTLEHPYFQ